MRLKLPKKINSKKVWDVVDRLLPIVLIFPSYFFIQGVWQDYVTEKSNMSYEELPIEEQPTITLCFDEQRGEAWNRKMFHLNTDINITYYKLVSDNGEDRKEISMVLEERDDNTSPEFGNEIISLRKMQSCYKITAQNKVKQEHVKNVLRMIMIDVNPNLLSEVLQTKARYYFSSESNAYGVESGIFHHGKELVFEAKNNQAPLIKIQPKIIHYLKEKTGCREYDSEDSSFWQLFEPVFVQGAKINCPNACSSRGLPNGTLGKCKSYEDWKCSEKMFVKALQTNKINSLPCRQDIYEGKVQQLYPIEFLKLYFPSLMMSSTTNLKYAMYYAFEAPEKLIKNEESLVMPTLNMIGSIGGTVGIFIEFDFFNTILKMINLGKIVLLKMKVLKVKDHLAWTIIEWMVFLAVGTYAIYSSDGILQDYAKGRSSFAIGQQPITRHPTITICFDELSEALYRRMFSLGEDFNVTYITESGLSLILKDGENASPFLINETLIVRKDYSCFSITSKMNPEGQLPSGQERTLKVEFGRHLKGSENAATLETHDSLPYKVSFIASIEAVSYGIETQIVVDGNMHLTEVDLNHHAIVNFSPKMNKYLLEKGCNDTTFRQAIEAKMLEEMKENCATVCMNLQSSSSGLEKCQTKKEQECANAVEEDVVHDLYFAGFSPCTTLEYSGMILENSKIKGFPPLVDYGWNQEEPIVHVDPQWSGKPTAIMTYKFEKPENVKVYEEYIVASFVDIIGIVGGTLGLYIGFSFFDTTLSFFNYIISFVDMLKGSKLFQKKKEVSKTQGTKGVSQKPENEKGPAANSKNIKDLKENHGNKKDQKDGNSSNMNKTKEEPVEIKEIQEITNGPTKTTVAV